MLLSNEKRINLINSTIWTNIKINWKSYTKKLAYHMVPFI